MIHLVSEAWGSACNYAMPSKPKLQMLPWLPEYEPFIEFSILKGSSSLEVYASDPYEWQHL